jgi:hypothetical protein
MIFANIRLSMCVKLHHFCRPPSNPLQARLEPHFSHISGCTEKLSRTHARTDTSAKSFPLLASEASRYQCFWASQHVGVGFADRSVGEQGAASEDTRLLTSSCACQFLHEAICKSALENEEFSKPELESQSSGYGVCNTVVS